MARLSEAPAAARLTGGPDADLATLGRTPPPPRRRDPTPPRRRPQRDQQYATHVTMLLDALSEAGAVTARDEAAVAAVAALDTTTVGTVVQWIRRR